MHDRIEKFQEILEKDLKEKLDRVCAAGTVTPDDLTVIDKATDVMLDLIKYDEWKMGEGGSSYDDGYSNRRGRSMTTGRYVSRDSYPMRSYDDGYSMRRSYDNGYSGHNRMIEDLEKMYDNSRDERERHMISEWIKTAEMQR
jgi:hypothetical protein